MDKKLEKIFNECIERLLQGETIDDCLKSYPDVAIKLEPLLKTAVDISWTATKIEPRPVFKTMARARIQGAFIYAQQQKQQKPKQSGFFSLQRAWVPALSIVLVLILSSAGTVAASSNALPDETLYPVKEVTENARLALTFSDAGKAKYYMELAETRSQEIVEMALQGKTEIIVEVTEKLADHLEKADMAIKRVEASAIEQLQTPQPIIVAPAAPEDSSQLTAEPPEKEMAPEEPAPTLSIEPTEDSKSTEGSSKQDVTPQEPTTTSPIGEIEDSKSTVESSKQDVTPQEPTTTSPVGETEVKEEIPTPVVTSNQTTEVEPKVERIKIPEVEQLRKTLKDSLSNNLLLLEDALNKTPEGSRVALIKAIEASNKTREQIQREIEESEGEVIPSIDNVNKTQGTGSSDNTTDLEQSPGPNPVSSDNTTKKYNQNPPVPPSQDSNTNTSNSKSRTGTAEENNTDTGKALNETRPSSDSTALVSDNITKT